MMKLKTSVSLVVKSNLFLKLSNFCWLSIPVFWFFSISSSIFSGVSNPFAVYTQLVSNNEGQNLGIQTLPNTKYESMVIPAGVNAEAGTSITFH